MDSYQYSPIRKGSKLRGLLSGLYVGLLILGASTEAFVAYKIVNNPATLGVSSQQQSGSTDKLAIPPKPGLQSFVSQKYGYGFYYQSSIQAGGIRLNYTVSELDSGIVIIYDDQAHQPIRILEAFSKDSSDSLTDAIKKQLFNSSTPTDCQVNAAPNLDDKNIPTGFVVATLQATRPSNNNPAVASDSSIPNENCPTAYATANSNPRFFLTDPKHPNVFLFIDIGPNPLSSDKNESGRTLNWSDTIIFPNK